VNVQVPHRLTRGLTNIHPDVEAIRCVTPQDFLARNADGVNQRLSFWGTCIEPATHVATCHQKRMSGGDRKRVPQTDDERGLHEDVRRIRVAERAFRLEHVSVIGLRQVRS
jgi:hypothetical protein